MHGGLYRYIIVVYWILLLNIIFQDLLPMDGEIPHCFLPLHLWLDKSNVSTTVKMHPIILHPGFLPSKIRNGSGNGGGVLLGYMPIVSSVPLLDSNILHSDIAPSFRSETPTKLQRMRMTVSILLKSLNLNERFIIRFFVSFSIPSRFRQ